MAIWGSLTKSFERKRREKQRGKERYTYLNAEFQRRARKDKKAFLSDQWKEIEENNRIGKTRDLFEKVRDTKGICHAKMGSIKDRTGMEQTEAKNIKKRWQRYIEELYKKNLHDPGNHDCFVTHLEPDILECKVKWALGSITMNKDSGGGGNPVSSFKTYKMMLWKCCTHCASKFGKLSSGHRTGKGQFHSNLKERQCQSMFKLLHNCTRLTC